MTDPVDTNALRARADDDDALGYPEAAAIQRAAAVEVDRLRAVIENAPHHWQCHWDGVNINDVCTCWKADTP